MAFTLAGCWVFFNLRTDVKDDDDNDADNDKDDDEDDGDDNNALVSPRERQLLVALSAEVMYTAKMGSIQAAGAAGDLKTYTCFRSGRIEYSNLT